MMFRHDHDQAVLNLPIKAQSKTSKEDKWYSDLLEHEITHLSVIHIDDRKQRIIWE